ncbi:magnesium transporter CorA family protein [Bacillus sp. AFS031507]|uniref:magnesium transporter CorA family protein n=1 Tax=Bacillus sp. AFS031507 TaxID=2033496 RepID=UPI000BFE13E0|nr:magnesium transporter CorA family protein [Bacillus sp. AFS031507]PGY12554.1 Mg2+ transporter protein, CorA-like protein [Bacillus sp. AFS031507]
MEKTIGPNKWKWYQFDKNDRERIGPIIENVNCGSTGWLEQLQEHKTNFLRIKTLDNGSKVVTGSLIYQQNFEEELDYKIFHFYVSTEQLITVDLRLSSFKHIHTEDLLRLIDRTENPVDGFLIFLGELMNEMLYEIDQFEDALKTLIWSVRKRNETSILEKIYTQRHELLVWKNLLIPIKELKMGIEEINLNEVSTGDIFKTTCKRIDRAVELLNEYEHELDSIINLEEVISSHRGNEIMKTLTVITTIFTPVMAFGSLWGMNFKHMPELEWKFGYTMSVILIGVSTILLYGFLKFNGWTGDLLRGKKKGSFFK